MKKLEIYWGVMIYNCDELSFQILTVDRFYHKKGTFQVKARPYAALSYRESGTGTFKIGGKTFQVKPGDVLFIPADTPYEVEYSVSESIVANLHSCNYSEPEMFELSQRPGISILFLQMLDEWQCLRSANRVKATVYTALECIREYNGVSIENTSFSECLAYIEKHFCDPAFDLAELCETTFISPSSLHRLFVKHFGVSPKQYIIKLRINKALSLLIENKLSVKEISFASGFADEKYFSRAFKNKYGYPPSQLRRNMMM